MKLFYISALFSFFYLVSCSTQKIVIRQMTPIFEKGVESIFEENDLKFAESALAGNLKLIEALIKSDSANEKLLLMAAQGYAGYALGFLEDDEPERARDFYLRARDYSLSILNRRAETDLGAVPLDELKKILDDFNRKNVPALFWAAFSWAGYVNLTLTSPAALIEMPRIEMVMRRVEELNGDYFHGSVYLFFGTLYGIRPRMMGGDPDKAHDYFQKAMQVTENKFLLAYVYAARYYAAKILDEKLFGKYLQYVNETPADVFPEMQLINQIAKNKAKILEQKQNEIF